MDGEGVVCEVRLEAFWAAVLQELIGRLQCFVDMTDVGEQYFAAHTAEFLVVSVLLPYC